MVNMTVLFLRAYSHLSDLCGTVKKLIDYYTSSTPSKWVFLTSSTTPIPLGAFHNSRYDLPSNIEYTFDTYNQTLLQHRTSRTSRIGTLPLLSGTLTVGDRTFSMDEFIEKAQFEMTKSTIPIPLMILRCWSILHGVWFCDEHKPVFDFIDMEGNEHSFEVFSSDLDYEQWDQLLLGNTELDDDSDDEAEAEVEAEVEVETETEAEAESPSESTDAPAIPSESTDAPAIPSESTIPVEESSGPTPLPPSQSDSDVEVEATPVLTDVPVLSS